MIQILSKHVNDICLQNKLKRIGCHRIGADEILINLFKRISIDSTLTDDYTQYDYKKCYAILQISRDSDQEQIRQAFLELVKKYHPDSGSVEANAEKFSQIETAYRKLQKKFSQERWGLNDGSGEYGLYHEEKEEIKNFDIHHTAPQHRQYLSYGGHGMGTPGQRQRQYDKIRAATAIDNVYNHRVGKLRGQGEDELVAKDRKEAQKIKLRSEMDRLVEDLIQESMARGDFANLSGSGKPLQQRPSNPYVDFVTQKMNQVLIDNGFTPEWITLQKEIPREIQRLRNSLGEARAHLGPHPLDPAEQERWADSIQEHQPQVRLLNAKIGKYNLVVPLLQQQMLLVMLDREAEKILHEGRTAEDQPSSMATATDKAQPPRQDNQGFLALLANLSAW